MKEESILKRMTGAQGNHGREQKHTAVPYTHCMQTCTHISWDWQPPLLDSVCMSSLSPRLSTSSRWKSRMLQHKPPTGLPKTSIRSLNTSKARCTHTHTVQAYTNKRERSPATTYHKHETFSYAVLSINIQSWRSQTFQAGEHCSTDSWLIHVK